MRLNGMLLGAETGVVIWSGTFTGRKGECESVLSELAPELARAVGSAMVRAAEHAPDAGGGVGDDAGDGLRRFSAV
jgi:hypothetical protein